MPARRNNKLSIICDTVPPSIGKQLNLCSRTSKLFSVFRVFHCQKSVKYGICLMHVVDKVFFLLYRHEPPLIVNVI